MRKWKYDRSVVKSRQGCIDLMAGEYKREESDFHMTSHMVLLDHQTLKRSSLPPSTILVTRLREAPECYAN